MMQKLKHHATGRTALVGLAIVGLSQAFLAGHVLPAVKARQPSAISDGMLLMIDFQPLASAEAQYRTLNLYAPDVLDYVHMMYATDFVLPLGMALLFVGLLGILLRPLGKADAWGWLLVVPLLGAPFDYLENAIALFLLSQGSTHVHLGLARFAGLVTAAKLLFYGVTMALTFGLSLGALGRFLGRRGGAT